jgi:hypothetical protein
MENLKNVRVARTHTQLGLLSGLDRAAKHIVALLRIGQEGIAILDIERCQVELHWRIDAGLRPGALPSVDTQRHRMFRKLSGRV